MRRVLRQVMTGLVSMSGAYDGLAVATTAAETRLRAAAAGWLQPCARMQAQRHARDAPAADASSAARHTRTLTVRSCPVTFITWNNENLRYSLHLIGNRYTTTSTFCFASS